MKSALPLLLVRIQTDPGQLFLSYLWEFLQVLPSTTTSILPPQLQRSLSCEYRSPATPPPAMFLNCRRTFIKLSKGSYRSSLTRQDGSSPHPSLEHSGTHNRTTFLSKEIHPRSLFVPLQPLFRASVWPKGSSTMEYFCTMSCVHSASGGLVLHVFLYLMAIVFWSFKIKSQFQPFPFY